MKSLNLAKFQTEFIMLTMFHGAEFKAKIEQMPLEPHIKETMQTQIDEFLAKLLELSGFDPSTVSGDKQSNFTSEVRLARDKALSFA